MYLTKSEKNETSDGTLTNSTEKDSTQEISGEDCSQNEFSTALEADDEKSKECDEEFLEDASTEEITKAEEIAEARAENESLFTVSDGEDVEEAVDGTVDEDAEEGANEDVKNNTNVPFDISVALEEDEKHVIEMQNVLHKEEKTLVTDEECVVENREEECMKRDQNIIDAANEEDDTEHFVDECKRG